ncbi:MAG: hypothetical protein P8N49_07775 [Opitutales bacterium]|nr:hypothetical protein [Opitutales bacterium]
MTIPEENPTDDELAGLMNDSENSNLSDEETAGVERGIPPEVASKEEAMSEEETFSMDDFDEEMTTASSGIKSAQKVDPPIEAQQEKVTDVSSAEALPRVDSVEDSVLESPPSSTTAQNGSGDVSEFRKSLSNLSRQLEIDKLAYLHKSLSEKGGNLPSLDHIADDIHGSSSLSPDGDLDSYSHRPAARLEGWISGLSFGSNRRAKKFSK